MSGIPTAWSQVTLCAVDGIYRDDIVFKDPRNTFRGKKNYRTICWSLRLSGKLVFSKLYVEVKRIWQPEESVIR